MGGLLCACSQGAAGLSYKITVPTLSAPPLQLNCTANGVPTVCTCFVQEDANLLIRKLKAACLASGGTEDACQTTPTTNQQATGSSD